MALELLTKREAAEICKVSARTLERLILQSSPRLEVIRLGAQIRIKREDLEAWLDQLKASDSTNTQSQSIGTSAGQPATGAGRISARARKNLQRLRDEHLKSSQSTKRAGAR